MSDLSEFLLARIDEEEALARKVRDRALRMPPLNPGGVGSTGLVGVPFRRALADCEAKREIVMAVLSADDGQAHPMTLSLGDEILMWLALPHADHPDHDENWRP